MTYVLDACALIALIKAEEGADAVQHLIEQAINEEITLCMSMANFIEVHYQFYRDSPAPLTRLPAPWVIILRLLLHIPYLDIKISVSPKGTP
ncbi:hypothetical protein FACS1894163_10510 [Spirochaetia bacterium]|nr:hypothetical protein FACS1894163_10510 [Spirochaetia bacterium]